MNPPKIVVRTQATPSSKMSVHPASDKDRAIIFAQEFVKANPAGIAWVFEKSKGLFGWNTDLVMEIRGLKYDEALRKL